MPWFRRYVRCQGRSRCLPRTRGRRIAAVAEDARSRGPSGRPAARPETSASRGPSSADGDAEDAATESQRRGGGGGTRRRGERRRRSGAPHTAAHRETIQFAASILPARCAPQRRATRPPV